MLKRIILAITALLLITLTACSADGYTDQSMRSLRYEKGASQGGKFVECVEPGEKIVTNDAIYAYPITQRESVWDSDNFGAGSNSADYNDLRVQDREGQAVFLKMKIQFFLNTECDTLRKFHEVFGKTRHAYFNEDGSYNDGWIWMMTNYIAAPAAKLAKSATQGYLVEDLWLDTAKLDEVADKIEERLQAEVDAGMQGDEQFYKDLSVNVFAANPSPEFRQIFEDRKAAQARAETAELNREAKIAEAKANAQVAQEEAKAREAEIKGYGGPEWYACMKSIEKNLPCFQPNGTIMVSPPR